MRKLPFGRLWRRTQSRRRWGSRARNPQCFLASAAVRLEDRTLLAVATAVSSDGGSLTEQTTTPTKVRVVNDRYLFLANGQGDGDQFSWTFLYSSDGTAAGTGVIARTGEFGVMQNVAYFASDDATFNDSITDLDRAGSSIWRSDGTATGTSLVMELPTTVSNPRGFYGVGNTLYFVVTNGTAVDLMKSDGTAAGTVTVKTGVASTGTDVVSGQADANGKFYFTIRNQAGDDTLWVSDGTTAGTTSLKTFTKGTDGITVTSMTNGNGRVFFYASNGSTGRNLWTSDGSVAGTLQLAVAGSSPTTPIAVLNGVAYFPGNDGFSGVELWSSDGTVAGTTLLQDINPGSVSSTPGSFLTSGNSLYFFATDADHGRELWKTDGTQVGTQLLVEFLPGTSPGLSQLLAEFNGRIYFTGNAGAGLGIELYSTDATTGGTTLVKDIFAGSASSSPSFAAVASGKLLFFAADQTASRELWGTDGTTAGTQLVKNINPKRQTTAGLRANSLGRTYGELNGSIYFSGQSGFLYRSDGLTATALGSSPIEPWNFFNFKGSLYYNAMLASGLRVINTAGVTSVVSGSLANGVPLAVIGEFMYVQVPGPNSTSDLWRTDGTTAGTTLVKSSINSVAPPQVFATDGVTYFVTFGVTGNVTATLYRTDGTPAGTSSGVMLIGSSVPEQPFEFSARGGLMYYIGRSGSGGLQLMRSDGTAPGTFSIKDLSFLDGPTELTAVGNKLFFSFGSPSTANRELWVSDGTAAGTIQVTEIRPGSKGSRPYQFVAYNNRVYFSAFSDTYGRELWSSDGTAAGTQIVADIRPGSLGSNPTELAVVEGKLYFAADGGFFGRELWVTDGTAAGTKLYADINPILGSHPTGVVPFGSKPMFTAYTLSTDRELWTAYEQNGPANLTLTTAFAENQPVGSNAGTLTTVSNVSGAVYTLSLVAGPGDTDNSLFTVSGNILKTNAVFDFETRRLYSIRVRTTDQFGLSYERSMEVQLTDVNEAPSQLILTPTVGTIPENTTGGGTVTTFQIFDDALGSNIIGLSGPDASAFTRIGNTIALRSTVVPDYEAKTSYSVTLTVRDLSLPTSTWIAVPFTLNVLDIDEFDVGNVTDSDVLPNEISEAATAGTYVGLTAFAMDADGTNNVVSYSLVNTAGGRFAIDGVSGAVRLVDPTQINYESAASHVIVVRATGQDGSFKDQSFTISVIDVNEFGVGPVSDVDPASDRISENAAAGAAVGITANAVDLDASASPITYSLIDNAGGRFAIDASTGVVTVANSSLLDFEIASSAAITIQAASTDGSKSTRTFIVQLNDIDEFDITPLNDLDAQPDVVPEDAVAGTTVGVTTFASDADGSNSNITYSLIQDDSGRFQIDPGTGVVTVRVSGSLDFEQSQASTITVRAASADGSTSTRSFVISIADVNEFNVSAPIDVDPSANTVAENALAGGTVGVTVLASDQDGTTNGVTYSLIDNAGGRFGIRPDGVVVVNDGALIDCESAGSYVVIGRATSEDGSFKDSAFTINVQDVDEFGLGPVSDVDPAPNQVVEGAANGTPVGVTGFAFDPDATAPAATYSLPASANGRFAIDPVSGVVTVARSEWLDREAAAAWSITVKAATPDGSFTTKAFSITLLDVSDTPVGPVTDADPVPNQVLEGAPNGTAVGITGWAVDKDLSSNSVTYSLTANAGGRFAIDPVTGVVTIARSEWLDREAAAAWSITVKATSQDGSWSVKAFTVSLLDAQDTPVGPISDTNPAASVINENAANGTAVGITAWAVDQDLTNNAVTYSLASDAGGRFAIDPVSGVVTVAHGEWLDRESAGAWSITVKASSEDGSASLKAFSITLNDVNDNRISAISDLDAAPSVIPETALNGATVGITAKAIDADVTNHGVTYSLTSSANGRFAIDPVTGVVTVARAEWLDYEGPGASAWSITVKATSQDGSSTQAAYSIQVRGVNEFPVGPVHDVEPAANQVQEIVADGTLVGIKAFANDPDVTGDGVIYSLTDNAGGRFAIDAVSGVVSVADGALLDFETAASHQITVLAQGEDGSSSTASFTIAVADVFETPEVVLSNSTIDENLPVGTTVGSLSVRNMVATSPVYTLVSGTGSTDNAKFTISGDQLKTNSLLNFEAQPTYSVRVQMKDSAGHVVVQVLTIDLRDVNEAPTGLSLSATSIAENNPIDAVIGTFSGIDPESSDTLTYSLVPGTGSTDNAKFTIVGNELRVKAPLGTGTKASIRLRVTDQNGLWFEKTFSISLTN